MLVRNEQEISSVHSGLFLLSMEALLKKKLGRESRDYLAITSG